jgi:hypothetical protein
MYKGIYLLCSLQKNIFILNEKNGDSTSFIIQSHCSLEMRLSRTLFSCIMALTSIFSIYQWLIRCYFVIKEATHFRFFVALTPETEFVQWLFMCGPATCKTAIFNASLHSFEVRFWISLILQTTDDQYLRVIYKCLLFF